ncbi:MAG: phosphate acyltransferase PlsX [Limnochordia bacterium]
MTAVRREACSESRRWRIAVDAMGGDHAPEAIVGGAVLAARELPVEILLVGEESRLKPLAEASQAPANVSVVHASEVIAMDAHPVEAVRRQRDSSIVVAARLVKAGEADALVSAGSTGAAMACTFLEWGRIKGIDRPAISAVLPTLDGACIMLDVGAQVDCHPRNLAQFAVMGSLYAQLVLGIERPRVGLLNNGEEEGKGCELVREAYPLLAGMDDLNFIGNVEGRDILAGKADVVVCDGFVGNVVLKFAEGMGAVIFDLLREAVSRSTRTRLGGLLLRPALKELWRKMDYTEYGGAPLLGVQGVCIISHGSSNEKAVKNAIRVACESAAEGVVGAIAARITEIGR